MVFDVFPNLVSSIASFLFPLFASYKALNTSDPAQLTPWLMYWVVLACTLLVESWTEWILIWVPFYAYIRLFFLLYLVLPQTQGARIIYQTHLHPYLRENEAAIDDFISSAHDRMRAAGMAYLKRAIEYLKTKVLGMPPEPEQPPAYSSSASPSSGGQSYTQSLLARFSLPAARWSAMAGTAAPGTGAGAGAGGANAAATDFYNLLAGTVSAALGGAAVSRSAAPAGAGGSGLIPSHVGEADKASFIATQRERLTTLLAALDREAAQLSSSSSASREAAESSSRSNTGGGADNTPLPTAANPWDSYSQASSESTHPSSGLSKSRSEQDFEKIEAESGADDDDDDGEAGTVRRRAAGGSGGGGGGGWLPWGWGGSGSGPSSGAGDGDGGDVGRSSGVEK